VEGVQSPMRLVVVRPVPFDEPVLPAPLLGRPVAWPPPSRSVRRASPRARTATLPLYETAIFGIVVVPVHDRRRLLVRQIHILAEGTVVVLAEDDELDVLFVGVRSARIFFVDAVEVIAVAIVISPIDVRYFGWKNVCDSSRTLPFLSTKSSLSDFKYLF